MAADGPPDSFSIFQYASDVKTLPKLRHPDQRGGISVEVATIFEEAHRKGTTSADRCRHQVASAPLGTTCLGFEIAVSTQTVKINAPRVDR